MPSGLVPGTLLWAYFWAFLGQRGGTRVAPGTVPLRNPEGTSRKACLEVFLTEAFGNPLGSWTSAPSGHGCPRRNACFFSRILTALTEVLGRDICASGPQMSAGCPSQKLPLWADFSFLTKSVQKRIDSLIAAPSIRT